MPAPARPGSAVLIGAAGAALAAYYFLPMGWPTDTAYLLVVGAAPLAAWLGARHAPPGRRLVPGLITAGLLASALGDLVWMLIWWSGGDPDVSLADPFYVVGYLALGAGMLVIAVRSSHRGGRARLDVDAAIDALTVVVVSVMVLWTLAVRDIVDDDSATVPARVLLSAYPILDAVLLALVLRVLSVRRHREALGFRFAVGVGCWLASDLGYLFLDNSDQLSPFLDMGWMVGGLLVASSTWRRQVPEADDDEPATPGAILPRVALATVPLLVPPVLHAVSAVRHPETHELDGLVQILLVAAIVIVRMARLLSAEARGREELARARDEALEASRAKSAFLATMSHEIRTPMNGVLGLNHLLLSTELDERQRQYAEGVRTSGQALLSVINDVLDFSKIEAGRLELEHLDFDPVELFEGVAEVVAETAHAKQVALLAYWSPELPLALRGDAARIRQVLINLAGNAVKFTEHGEVVVRAHLAERTGDGVVIRFEVVDTGIGIASDDLPRMFEAFSQADSSITRRFGGSGLGLAICHQLVSAMGGTLGVESAIGQGSTFWFTVPLELAAATPHPAGSTARGRVLVVDDSEVNQIVATGILRNLGFDADVVDDGAEAVSAVARTTYDAVLMDVRMPGLDGCAATTEIRRSEEGVRRTPVIGLTAGASDDERARCLAAGMDDYLAKPVSGDALGAALEPWVRSSSPS